jgi:hypothetical protein
MDKQLKFDTDKIIEDLMLRVFRLEIELVAHRNATVLLLQNQLGIDTDAAVSVLQQAINTEHERQKVEHPWFEEHWKDKMNDLGI